MTIIKISSAFIPILSSVNSHVSEKAEFFQQTTLQLPVSPTPDRTKERSLSVILARVDDVTVNIDENQPLISKQGPVVTIHTAVSVRFFLYHVNFGSFNYLFIFSLSNSKSMSKSSVCT